MNPPVRAAPRLLSNRLAVNVVFRNGQKYFYSPNLIKYFSYIDDKTIGELIDEPMEISLPDVFSPYADEDMNIVLIMNQVYYISKDRKFYPYDTLIRRPEVPEPYCRLYLQDRYEPRDPAMYTQRTLFINGEDKIFHLFPGYTLCPFDEYKEEVVLDLRQMPLMKRLPINITELKCECRRLTSLPPLPACLKVLKCHSNQLTMLPELPPNLEILCCGRNQLTALPLLPATLKELSFSYNQIGTMPVLPEGLKKLICNSNPLKCLPVLPTGLYTLSCKNTQIKCVPNLPPTLGYLDCSHNDLFVLPALPPLLDTLWCTNCRLTKLPQIPESLTRLDYSHNRIRGVVDFPVWVMYYKCSYNPIESFNCLATDIPPLLYRVMPIHKHCPFNLGTPRTLVNLNCSHTRISELPGLPTELRKLNCSYTRMQSLPDLPPDLYHLDCSYTSLLKLPAMPRHVTHLDCSATLISTLPELEVLPFRFGSLSCYNTRLDPELMRYIDHGDLDSVNYYTFAQRHKETLKKDVRPVLNLWIALGCDRNSEYIESEYGVLPAEITRRIVMFLSDAVNKQPVAGVWSLTAIVAGFRSSILEPIVRPEDVV